VVRVKLRRKVRAAGVGFGGGRGSAH
jgi:hypothetical protein